MGIKDVFTEIPSDQDAAMLDKYTRINMFGPGSSALGVSERETARIAEIVKDERVQLFLTKTDLVAIQYAREVLAQSDTGNFSRVVWGEEGDLSLNVFSDVTKGNHTIHQWVLPDVSLSSLSC